MQSPAGKVGEFIFVFASKTSHQNISELSIIILFRVLGGKMDGGVKKQMSGVKDNQI